jgi:hypothetical protein
MESKKKKTCERETELVSGSMHHHLNNIKPIALEAQRASGGTHSKHTTRAPNRDVHPREKRHAPDSTRDHTKSVKGYAACSEGACWRYTQVGDQSTSTTSQDACGS